jgi:hypothetical protein
MTDTVKDPRIEAVAKLLFTGPLGRCKADDWDQAKRDYWGTAVDALMAAEDVLRGIDEATAWEYRLTSRSSIVSTTSREVVDRAISTGAFRGHRRRSVTPAGPWEPIPDDPA